MRRLVESTWDSLVRIFQKSVTWVQYHWAIALVTVLTITVLIIPILAYQRIEEATTDILERANSINDNTARTSAVKDAYQYRTDNEIKLWTGLVQALGGVVVGAGAYVAWQNWRLGQNNLNVAQERLDIDRENQVTNRFTQAIGQLGAELKDGKPNLEIRLGGIYALERIARDYQGHHWNIMEVLTAYIRQNAQWKPPPTIPGPSSMSTPMPASRTIKPRADIQAALSVIGRRKRDPEWREPFSLDLAGTDLRGADLSGAHLENATLDAAHLDGATLESAHLEKASLMQAHLGDAQFRSANLDGALLGEAQLKGANFPGASLETANFSFANLKGATFHKAHLRGAFFIRADLTQAGFGEADLEGATFDHACTEKASFFQANLKGTKLRWTRFQEALLSGAHLEGADLNGATGLTRQQFDTAHECRKTAILPHYLIVSDAPPGPARQTTGS